MEDVTHNLDCDFMGDAYLKKLKYILLHKELSMVTLRGSQQQ